MTTQTSVRSVVHTLNTHLSDLINLHWQIKQAHWNVTGLTFQAIHELFDDQARIAREMADTAAERVRALKSPAEGTIMIAAERSKLSEFPHGEIKADDAIRELVHRYEQLSEMFSSASDEASEAGDKATEDIYIEFMRMIDQQAYFLRSHLA